MNKILVGFFLGLPLGLYAQETFIVPYECPHATIPLRHEDRPSTFPYLSGDAFRQACDFIIDETKIPFNPHAVCDGATIFVNADCLDYFFSVIHPTIKARYILVTHNSDRGVPGDYTSFLDDTSLVAWFGQNSTIDHPKVFPIPIGISNKHWFNGDPQVIEKIAKQSHRKQHLLYMNFIVQTNPGKRASVRDYFLQATFCYSRSNQPHETYLQDIAESQFVVSPEGNGIDCVRTWEALLLGSIPIVKHSSIDLLFKDLPVLLIDDWSQVTEQFLHQAYEAMTQESYNMQKLYAPYWLDQIYALQAPIKKTAPVS